MKFVFFGSPNFAAIVLEKLLAQGCVPDILVCSPDRPAGRHQVLTAPATKKLLLDRRLPTLILQPEKLKDIADKLQNLEADFFVVAAYAKIISQSILDIPRLGTVGVHPSLLPKYRGASPIQSALLHGEEKTGVSLYMLTAGVDDGPVLAHAELPVLDNDDYSTLEAKLARLGGELLAELIPKFLAGEVVPTPQHEDAATFTKKFTAEDGFVDHEVLIAAMAGKGDLAEETNNKIRALAKEPGVWTIKDGKRIKLLESELRAGKLSLLTIQHEGKTPEAFRAF